MAIDLFKTSWILLEVDCLVKDHVVGGIWVKLICKESWLSVTRIFTAKTQRTLRSSRRIRISCLPLRSLRLRGENAFKRQRTLRSTRYLATLISWLGCSALGFFSENYYSSALKFTLRAGFVICKVIKNPKAKWVCNKGSIKKLLSYQS